MSEHTETHRVSTEEELPDVLNTLMAAFGRDAVKAAWLEASGESDVIEEMSRELDLYRRFVQGPVRRLLSGGADRRIPEYRDAHRKAKSALFLFDELLKDMGDSA